MLPSSWWFQTLGIRNFGPRTRVRSKPGCNGQLFLGKNQTEKYFRFSSNLAKGTGSTASMREAWSLKQRWAYVML